MSFVKPWLDFLKWMNSILIALSSMILAVGLLGNVLDYSLDSFRVAPFLFDTIDGCERLSHYTSVAFGPVAVISEPRIRVRIAGPVGRGNASPRSQSYTAAAAPSYRPKPKPKPKPWSERITSRSYRYAKCLGCSDSTIMAAAKKKLE